MSLTFANAVIVGVFAAVGMIVFLRFAAKYVLIAGNAVVSLFRPDYVYIVRREDNGIAFAAFYSGSDAGRFCLDSSERLSYYGVKIK